MDFLHTRVHLQEGGAVQVKLYCAEANVRIMDDLNFRRYRSGSSHDCFGGHYQESPAIIHPPHAGAWNVVIDQDGSTGNVEASIDVVQ